MRDRILGALLGLALGDALGATLEFMPREQVRRRFPGGLREIVGGGPFGWKPGETTDDTAMALGVARGVLAAGRDAPVTQIVDAVGREFVTWYQSGPPDVGTTVGLALSSYLRCRDWGQAAAAVRETLGDRTAGNGALMRTLPVSVFWPDDHRRMADVSRAITRMTHPHPEAEWCSLAYNLLAARLLAGDRPRIALVMAMDDLPAVAPDLAGAHARLAPRLLGAAALAEEDIRATGYCVDTLEAALWAFLTADGAEECIVRAANLGGDADTVAAVAGGLAGAHYGAAALPERWVRRLEPGVREEIGRLVTATV